MSELQLPTLLPYLNLLEEATRYGSIAASMVEADLYERQTDSTCFSIETQTRSVTGLVSEERLVEEAAAVSELVLMSKMLSNLIRFETAQNAQDLTSAELNLSACVAFCK